MSLNSRAFEAMRNCSKLQYPSESRVNPDLAQREKTEEGFQNKSMPLA